MECDWTGYFSEGLAAVNMKDSFFYIDKTGNKVFSVNIPGVVYAGTFLNGLAVIVVNDKYGCIDRQGNIVLKPEYDNLSNTKFPVFQFRKGDTFGYIDIKGKVIWSTDTLPKKLF